MRSEWRTEAQQVIQSVLERIPPDSSEADVRSSISRAYPFGPRKQHPYKIWCEEVRRAMAKRFPKPVNLAGTIFEKQEVK